MHLSTALARPSVCSTAFHAPILALPNRRLLHFATLAASPCRSAEWRATVLSYWTRKTRCSTTTKHQMRRRGDPPHARHWLECTVVSIGCLLAGGWLHAVCFMPGCWLEDGSLLTGLAWVRTEAGRWLAALAASQVGAVRAHYTSSAHPFQTPPATPARHPA